jgi:hypothetical protein
MLPRAASATPRHLRCRGAGACSLRPSTPRRRSGGRAGGAPAGRRPARSCVPTPATRQGTPASGRPARGHVPVGVAPRTPATSAQSCRGGILRHNFATFPGYSGCGYHSLRIAGPACRGGTRRPSVQAEEVGDQRAPPETAGGKITRARNYIDVARRGRDDGPARRRGRGRGGGRRPVGPPRTTGCLDADATEKPSVSSASRGPAHTRGRRGPLAAGTACPASTTPEAAVASRTYHLGGGKRHD